MTDPSVQGLTASPPAAAPAAGGAAPIADGRFGGLLRSVQQSAWEVKAGDTLIGIVRRHYAAQGQALSDGHAYRLAKQLARHNGIADADLILPGQRLVLDRLPSQVPGVPLQALDKSIAGPTPLRSSPLTAAQALGAAQALRQSEVVQGSRASIKSYAVGGTDSHPVLERTLQRAVQKGFVPPHEAQAVHQRIVDMADRYGFKPDDFARVSLMESDGLNPKASNGRCHGIIQFCGGPGRGADSVGFGRNAREILGLSVMQQLDLVERYFKDVGLNPGSGAVKLDDLYLSVLMPSARREKQTHVPLEIAGQQAAKLYVNGKRFGVITRESIVQGLVQHARARLGMEAPVPTKVASALEPPQGTP